jgi:hypothetical protein
MYDTFQIISGATSEMRNGRCQAEDLHLFPIFTGTLGRSGDEVSHLYDILMAPSKSPPKGRLSEPFIYNIFIFSKNL